MKKIYDAPSDEITIFSSSDATNVNLSTTQVITVGKKTTDIVNKAIDF